jgi:hypothetical protein
MNVNKYMEDSRVCTHRVISLYIRIFLLFLPTSPGRRRDVSVICVHNHTYRIVINDKNVNLFQQIITI